MKTCETQILKPRVKLTLFDISVWPLKNYDLSYESNKLDIVQAYKTGKIRALKEGKAKITCKNSDKSIYATFDVEVKCDHFKQLIKTIDSSCSKKGKNIYKCDICKMQFESIIDTKPHDFEYELINKNSGKTKGTCKNCKAIINFNAPTEFEISWRNDETTKQNIYSNYLPENNPVGFLIIGFSKTNGDDN